MEIHCISLVNWKVFKKSKWGKCGLRKIIASGTQPFQLLSHPLHLASTWVSCGCSIPASTASPAREEQGRKDILEATRSTFVSQDQTVIWPCLAAGEAGKGRFYSGWPCLKIRASIFKGEGVNGDQGSICCSSHPSDTSTGMWVPQMGARSWQQSRCTSGGPDDV